MKVEEEPGRCLVRRQSSGAEHSLVELWEGTHGDSTSRLCLPTRPVAEPWMWSCREDRKRGREGQVRLEARDKPLLWSWERPQWSRHWGGHRDGGRWVGFRVVEGV